MSDEISVDAGLRFAKGNITAVSRNLGTKKTDMDGTRYVQGVQHVGTATVPIELGNLSGETLGWMWAYNLDSGANNVYIQPDSGADNMVKLEPSEAPQVFRLATNTPFVIASPAAADLEYLIIED